MNKLWNILLAEDNAYDVFLVKQALRKTGLASQLFVTQDGQETVSYLQGHPPYDDRATHPFPDLLLLDLNMPRLNGFEVLAWVRKNESCCRLIIHVLTASARQADIRRAYELGANSYVVKPPRMDELVAFMTALQQWHRFVSPAD